MKASSDAESRKVVDEPAITYARIFAEADGRGDKEATAYSASHSPPPKKKQNKPPKEIRRKERKENQTTTSTAVHVSGNPAICVRKKTRSYADMRSTLIDVDASFLLDHRQALRRRRSKLNQSAVLVSEVGFYRRQHSERKLSGLEGQATRPVQLVLHRTSTHCLRVREV